MSAKTRGSSPTAVVWAGEYIPSKWQHLGAALNVTANRVYLLPIASCWVERATIDALRYLNTNTILGNKILGIYGQGTGQFLPDGATLLAQSASAVAQTNFQEEALITAIQLNFAPRFIGVPYWFAVICSNAGNALFSPTNSQIGVGVASFPRVTACQYDAGAYALLNPCPATAQSTIGTYFEARVQSIP